MGAIEGRAWPRDPRYLVNADGTLTGPRGPLRGSLNPDGYRIVTVRVDGRRESHGVHAVVCETFHGPRPSPAHEAVHISTDRGDNRPRNVAWKTAAESRTLQGTRGRKLTTAQAREIRAAVDVPRAELARRYGVTPGTISHIRTGHTWAEPAP